MEVIWTPTPEQRDATNAMRLARRLGCSDYWELQRLSQDDPVRFWPEAIADMGLEFFEPWHTVCDDSRGPEWATWFRGGTLNIAWNCVHRWARGERANAPAAVWQSEDGTSLALTYAELSHEVTRFAEALVRLGVEPGDRVAIFLPMSPAVAIASHACAHVGAVQVPIFSGFAAPAIRARLDDSDAKVVISADWSLRRGRRVEMQDVLAEANERGAATVVWSRDGGWPASVTRQPATLAPLAVESEHPYLLAYTSGTTGRPKGALHVHGG